MTVSTQQRSGHPRPESGGPPPHPAGTPRRDIRRTRRRSGRRRLNAAVVLAAAGAAVLVAAAVFGYRFISRDVLGPQAVAEDYLAALASGDQAAAYELLPSTDALIPDDAAVYAAAGQKITGFEILEQEITGGNAVVRALVDQDGGRNTVELRLRDAGSRALLFTAWQLGPSAARTVQVNVPADTEDIRINGTDVALPSGAESVDVLLLPGSYIFDGPEERYLSYGPGKRVLVEAGMAGSPAPVRLRAAANAELAPAVQAQADAYLAACLSRTEAAPDACPNAAYSSYGAERIRNVKWSLERGPEYGMTGTPETGLTVYATGGKARVQYQEDTTGSGRWESRSDLVNISFSSGVEVTGESLGLDFRP